MPDPAGWIASGNRFSPDGEGWPAGDYFTVSIDCPPAILDAIYNSGEDEYGPMGS